MRVSTAQLYDVGISGLQLNQSSLLNTQNQLSTGKRVINPADDPVASARALVLTQSENVNSLYMTNQKAANSQLQLVEGTVGSLNDLLQYIRSQAVAAGNPVLTTADRQSMASDLQSRFQDLLGIANTKDGTGQYLFSGFQGQTKPFVVGSSGAVQYQGDDGQLEVQVTASRKIATTDAGSDIFMRIRQGNGSFATSTGGNTLNPPTNQNLGTGVVDQGSVLDPTKWNDPSNPGNFTIQFARDYTASPPTTTYNIIVTPASPATPYSLASGPFVPGQTIKLAGTSGGASVDYGASVTITGQPEDGDTFTVAPSKSNQDIFQTVQDFINLLKSPPTAGTAQTIDHSNLTTSPTATYSIDGSGNAQFSNQLGGIIANLDQALNKVNTVRATQGSRMNELDSLTSAGQAMDVQYQSAISNEVDVDYYSAISQLSKQTTQLQAAQQAFVKISALGLFKII